MAGQVGAHDEAAHGMAEQDVGRLAGVAGRHRAAQLVDVLDEHVLAAVRGQAPQLGGVGYALAVAHVVARAHHEAAAHEEAGELVVAPQVLGHAVHDLHDAARRRRTGARRALGRPDEAPDLGCAVVGQETDRSSGNRSSHARPPRELFGGFIIPEKPRAAGGWADGRDGWVPASRAAGRRRAGRADVGGLAARCWRAGRAAPCPAGRAPSTVITDFVRPASTSTGLALLRSHATRRNGSRSHREAGEAKLSRAKTSKFGDYCAEWGAAP